MRSSQPDPVDQPERTAHYDCAMCIAEMLHNTIAFSVLADIVRLINSHIIIIIIIIIIPLSPDQHHCSDEAKWRLGGGQRG